MLLASVVRLEGMRIPDLTFTHVGHPLHRGRMTSVESHKGATLASRLTIRFFVVTEERAKGDLPSTRPLSTLDVIAGSHSPASTTPAEEMQGDYTHIYNLESTSVKWCDLDLVKDSDRRNFWG